MTNIRPFTRLYKNLQATATNLRTFFNPTLHKLFEDYLTQGGGRKPLPFNFFDFVYAIHLKLTPITKHILKPSINFYGDHVPIA